MKLFFAPPSPFARKVRVLVRELNLTGKVTELAVHTTPIAPDPEVTAANPLSKIPTLVLNDGQVLFDSRVISEYLMSVAAIRGACATLETGWEQRVDERERWGVLQRQALADGILDAGLTHRYEMVLRPKELHWPEWMDAQVAKIERGLQQMEKNVPTLGDQLKVDAIAFACTLGWLEFRMPDIKWRETCPSLAMFFDAASSRPSMAATRP